MFQRKRLLQREQPVLPKLSRSRLRHLLWDGYVAEAWQMIQSIKSLTRRIIEFTHHITRPYAKKLWCYCTVLMTYIVDSEAAIVDHSRRNLSKTPVASSAAEGFVDELASTRMGKMQRMLWSPHGAHRVVTVRAAMLDIDSLANLRRTARQPKQPKFIATPVLTSIQHDKRVPVIERKKDENGRFDGILDPEGTKIEL